MSRHERPVEFGLLRYANSERAADLGVLGKVRVVQGGLPDVPLPGSLLLADLPELGVVQQHMADVHFVLYGSRELGHVLTETTVPAD